MDYQVVLSPSARSDIRDIVRYISLDDPNRAIDFGRFLIQCARSLAQFPLRGRVVPEFADESLREVIARKYRIVYRLKDEDQLIEIVRFWHAGRGTPDIIED